MSDSVAEPEFETWYERCWPALKRSLLVSTGDPELAEDVASEAFARAFARWDHVGAMKSPDGWVTRVAYNLVRSRWRRDRVAARWRQTRRVETTVETGTFEPDLWAAVNSLSPRARHVVALRYVLDYTQPEIADLLGIAPGTVASTLHAARRTLADRLDSEQRTDQDTEVSCEP